MFLWNTVRSPRAPAGSSMPVGAAIVASQGQGPCADWRQLPLLQRTALRNGGENEIPCPTFSISYIGRKDQSVMAAAAYNAGEKMYSERDHEWKHPHSSSERVVYREVMLPDNAPREYADSQTLWNAVDAAEKRKDAQTARRMLIVLPKELTYEQNLALIRDYCQQEFVSRGMICDLYYHDEGDGNPHVHLLLTLRAMDEHGEWLSKTRTEYVLDERGNRVKDKNGKWKRRNIDTVDWNDHKYAEIWRHDWEVMQNAALEQAGRPERIDMRSLERQGIEDRLPQQHLGPAAAAMERKGTATEKGKKNREILSINRILGSLKRAAKKLGEKIAELMEAIRHQEVLEKPQEHSLIDVILSYKAMREAGRESWGKYARDKAGIRDLQDMARMICLVKETGITTVDDLAIRLSNARVQLDLMQSDVRRNNQTIRDIDDFLTAIEDYRALAPIQEQLDKIHFKGRREAFLAEHADELKRLRKATYLREKLSKKLGISLPLDKDGAKKLKEQRRDLTKQNELLRPKLGQIRAELDQLSKLRYWTRKAIPEALQEWGDFSEQLEVQENRRELEQVMDAAIEAVTQETDEQQPVQDVSKQKHDQERQ